MPASLSIFWVNALSVSLVSPRVTDLNRGHFFDRGQLSLARSRNQVTVPLSWRNPILPTYISDGVTLMIRFRNIFCFVLALTCLFHVRRISSTCILRRIVTGMFSAAIIHLCPHVVQAALLLDFTGGNANTFGGNTTVGWEFTLNSPMLVDGLGFWDHGSDGLVNTHDVGIWNSSNTALLLTSTTVTNGSSTPVASTSTAGRWLFNNIPSIT